MVGIHLLAWLATLPFVVGAVYSDFLSEEIWMVRYAIHIPWFLAGGYILARYSLVLPASALGHRLPISAAWARTRSKGWKLVLLSAFPAAALMIGSRALGQLLLGGPWFTDLLLTVVFSLAGVLEVAVLSVAYVRFVPRSHWPMNGRTHR